WSGPELFPVSPTQLQTHLNLPRRGSGCGDRPGRTGRNGRRGGHAGSSHSAQHDESGNTKVGPVEYVESLRPKLQRRLFRHARSFEYRKIDSLQRRAGQDIAADIAIGARKRQGEGRSVNPMFRRAQVDVLQGSTKSHVGSIRIIGIPITRLIEPKCGSEGKAALQIDNRVDLPPAGQLFGETLNTAEKRLAFPER